MQEMTCKLKGPLRFFPTAAASHTVIRRKINTRSRVLRREQRTKLTTTQHLSMYCPRIKKRPKV